MSWPRRCAGTLGALVVLGNAASSHVPRADEDLHLRITAAVQEVEFGVAFDLTVERAWSRALEPEPWEDDRLAPLVLEPKSVVLEDTGAGFHEVRHYRARAFRTGELVLPQVWLRARQADGGTRIAASDEVALRVVSALSATDAGEVELPGPPFPAPRRLAPGPLLLGAGVTVLLAWAIVRAVRRRAQRARAPAAPHVQALARIEELRRRATQDGTSDAAYYVEASRILGDYLARHLDVPAFGGEAQTLLEYLTRSAVFEMQEFRSSAFDREAVTACFASIEHVKYAGQRQSAEQRRQDTDLIECLVRAIAQEPRA